MEFHEAANFLFDLRRFRMSPGIEATRDLLSALDDPHERVPAVQVAGSNGKGSTARMLESVLREAGLDVGLYTSPHLEDVRERVRVNGRKIPESALSTFVAAVEGYVNDRAAEGVAPTFFETLTAMALWHFEREDVDVAVLEVGIGGRYDATSVVDPVASAVTTVTLEHTGILGETVEEIARDKAHVAPADRPLVTATEGAALEAVREVAGEVLTVGGEGGDRDSGAVTADYRGITDTREGAVALAGPDWAVETALPTPGAWQARNAGVAAALARQVGDSVGADVSEPTLRRGLRSAHWPGRFEVVEDAPLVVLDGAHNPGGCAQLAETLGEFDYDDLHVVFGAMHDKDHAGMVDALPPVARAHACEPDLERAEEPAVLARVFERAGVDVTAADAVESAVEEAIAAAGPGDCVLVTGSLSTVAAARARWTRAPVRRRVVDVEDATGVLERASVPAPAVERLRSAGVHRTLGLRIRVRQARYLRETLLSLGGECAISGLADQGREPVDVVLMATLGQFRRLLADLDAAPHGLATVGDQIRRTLDLDGGADDYPWRDGTAVMGILNVTPDSFHDGGEYDATAAAVERAERMIAEGADVVDVGGESTRPGADPVPVETEIDRVVPVVERLTDLDAAISVDTRKAAVAAAALEAGADVVNDVSGLEDPEMRFVAAEHDAALVVMHSIDAPVVPDRTVAYDDVVDDVIDDLREQVLLAEKAGLDRSQIVVDPGLGFGKSAAESFELLGRVDELHALGCPVLVGHSHKSMFEAVGYEHGEREHATVGATAVAVERGADVVRVHDVAENVAAVRAAEAATPTWGRRGNEGGAGGGSVDGDDDA